MEAALSPRLRVVHTSPDAPPIDVLIDGSPLVTGLRYGHISGYGQLSPARHGLLVFGAGMEGRSAPDIDQKLEELQPGANYTLVAAGERKDLHALLLHDRPPTPGPGQVPVRVLHASPDAPVVDLWMRGRGVEFELVSYERATHYKMVPAGTYNLEVRPHGEQPALAWLDEYTLVGDRVYTLVLLGLLRQPPALAVLPIADPIRVCMPV